MRYLDLGMEVVLDRDQVFYEAATPPLGMGVCYVVSGKIELLRRFADGQVLRLETGPDGLFGLSETLENQPRQFTARALEPSTLYVWDTEMFERAISLYIELAAKAVQELSSQLRVVNEHLRRLE